MTLDLDSGRSEDLFEEKDEQFYLGLKMSKDKKYLLLSGVSKTSSKLWVLQPGNSKSSLLKVWQGSGKIYINHIEGYFLLWSLKERSELKLISDTKVNSILSKKRENIDLANIEGEVLFSTSEEEMIEEIEEIEEEE